MTSEDPGSEVVCFSVSVRNTSSSLYFFRVKKTGLWKKVTSEDDDPLAAGEVTVGTGENMKKLTFHSKSLFLENITFWAGLYPSVPQHFAFAGVERLPWQQICKINSAI